MAASAILILTDGTTSIDLISPHTGFHLESWRPNVAFYKGGGTFQNSPLATGRRLVDKKFENEIDVFSLKANDVSQDNIITDLQNIRRLLEQASDYWTADWQDEPVWIKAQAVDETNPRYALIHTGRIPEDENPNSQPFLQPNCASVMNGLTLVIEHELWTENEPGTGTAVALSAVETFDGRNLGNVNSAGVRVPTTAAAVYISSQQSLQNLTDIYVNDGGVFGANLMDAALPFDLFPAVPAVNDAIYFGIDTTIADAGPFDSLVFDLSVAQTQITGIAWEFSDVPGIWVAMNVQDNTNASGAMTGVAFDTTGVNSVHWSTATTFSLADWIIIVVNGVTGFWVRARVTAIGGAPTPPTQQNRDIYTIKWGYTEIQSSEIDGDVPSLLRMKLFNISDRDGGTTSPNHTINRVVTGLRSVDRGDNFVAYLNCSDRGNQTGITVSLGVNTAFTGGVNFRTWSSGEEAVYTSGGTQALADRVTFTLDPTLMQEFFGEYHVFLRTQIILTVGVDDAIFRLKAIVGSGGITSFSDTVTFSPTSATARNTAGARVIDLGKIRIPGGPLRSDETGDQTQIVVQVGAVGTIQVSMLDIVLVPVDEWSIDATDSVKDFNDSFSQNDRLIDIDSVIFPKSNIRSILRNDTDQLISFYTSTTNGVAILQSSKQQKMWILTMASENEDLTDFQGGWFSSFATAHRLQFFKNQRYLSMRGTR